MILRQFLHKGPVGISYLFGCGGRAAGAVVDLVGEIEPYLRAAEDAGVRIHFVIDTYVYADNLFAGLQLAEAAGAAYVLSAHADVSFPYKAVRDGEMLPLGNAEVKVLHTPGHTPEHICLLVSDRTRADEPWFVRTVHMVVPGAYAGSVCGRRLSGKPWSSIGLKKEHNEAFRVKDEAEFIRFMLAENPPAPPESAALRAANSGVIVAAA